MDYGTPGLVLLRMTAIFAVALIAVRIMGNRAVGQLSPFDFVLLVGIGDIVANVAMAQNESILIGAEGLVGLLILQQLLARLSLKNTFLRKLFEGTPVELIEDGRILHDNLTKTQFNLDDLRQELHKQGLDFSNLKDIKLARLESCGTFSLIKSPDMEPLTRRDLENFIRSLSENPFSPAGTGWAKIEQLAADVRVLAEQAKSRPAAAPPPDNAAAEQQLH
ncbi:MAG TPA: YetF domain-containing protein [Negativicutes bacterium]|nr:YetF domain-containing protein [Negativicutes bacterium]